MVPTGEVILLARSCTAMASLPMAEIRATLSRLLNGTSLYNPSSTTDCRFTVNSSAFSVGTYSALKSAILLEQTLRTTVNISTIALDVHITHLRSIKRAYLKSVLETIKISREFTPGQTVKASDVFQKLNAYTEHRVVSTFFQPPESLGPITSIPYQPRIPPSSNCVQYSSEDLYSSAANFFPKPTTSNNLTTSTSSPGPNEIPLATASMNNNAGPSHVSYSWSESYSNFYNPLGTFLVLCVMFL